MTEIPLSTLFIVFVVLVIISGFFSSSETSMMALNRYRLRHLAKTGNRGAKRTVYLLDRTNRLLGSILLGNNLVNTAAAALGTVIAFRLLGQSELSLTIQFLPCPPGRQSRYCLSTTSRQMPSKTISPMA